MPIPRLTIPNARPLATIRLPSGSALRQHIMVIIITMVASPPLIIIPSSQLRLNSSFLTCSLSHNLPISVCTLGESLFNFLLLHLPPASALPKMLFIVISYIRQHCQMRTSRRHHGATATGRARQFDFLSGQQIDGQAGRENIVTEFQLGLR